MSSKLRMDFLPKILAGLSCQKKYGAMVMNGEGGVVKMRECCRGWRLMPENQRLKG